MVAFLSCVPALLYDVAFRFLEGGVGFDSVIYGSVGSSGKIGGSGIDLLSSHTHQARYGVSWEATFLQAAVKAAHEGFVSF